MSIKNSLTNEDLGERFDNQFQLVNYAISLAKDLVERGEQLDTNQATEILERISDNKDLLRDDEEEEETEEE